MSAALGNGIWLKRAIKSSGDSTGGTRIANGISGLEKTASIFGLTEMRYNVWNGVGILSTVKSLSQLFATAKLANCMLHATFKLPGQIKGVTKAVRQTLSGQFRRIFFVNNARKTPNNRSLGQRLRRFTEQVTHLGGEDNGMRVRKWIHRKKAGWHVLFADANIPRTTTLIDQFHNAMDRKLFMMKGFHHAGGSQRVFINGLAILANLIPYQRRAII